MTDGGALDEQLQQFVGQPLAPPRVARDAVNLPMIRHWCDAMGDANPVYTRHEEALASVHQSIVAPPAMVQAWTMPGLARTEQVDGGAQAELFRLLDGVGYSSVVATNADDEYRRYLRLGDVLTLTATFGEISPLKRTSLGFGYFITNHHSWHDQDGELVASSNIRILKFAPVRHSPVNEIEQSPPAPVETSSRSATHTAPPREVEVGQPLGDIVIDITPTLIIATAIASRDYQDVHHDRDLAHQRGSKDIFMNILTTQGLLQRYVTDWAGPNAVVKAMRIRLGAPNYPYDTMVVSGRVSSISADKDRPTIGVETIGRNSLGEHVVGLVTVQLRDTR